MWFRRLLIACLFWSAPAFAGDEVDLVGFQFRLIWPNTGALSPDVFETAQAEVDFYIYCWDVSFPNGESSDDLGQPRQGLLLLGVRGADTAKDEHIGRVVHFFHTGGTKGAFGERDLYRKIWATRGETTWHPVTLMEQDSRTDTLMAQMGTQRIQAGRNPAGCSE